MVKFVPINGWTKEKIIERIKERNNGEKSLSLDKRDCKYFSLEMRPSEDGNYAVEVTNSCAVGCFLDYSSDLANIIEGVSVGSFYEPLLFRDNEQRDEILSKLPLDMQAMIQLQKVHDNFPSFNDGRNSYLGKTVQDLMIEWVEQNVVDTKVGVKEGEVNAV